jgi:hypothetical protein
MKSKFGFTTWAAGAALLALAMPAFGAATITIVNGDPAGVGFNDATVVTPVGGNSGTTLGQQRLLAFQMAADIWGATLTSSVNIRVLATWEALTCTATGAVLGSAGATSVFRDFTGAPKAGTWYGKAQTAKLLGFDPDGTTADLRARFNINLGNTGCLTGTPFYLGLDGNHGNAVDLVAVLLHEFAHGLGFQTYTNGSNGSFLSGFPSVWDHFLLDTTTNKLWKDMTAAERVTSGINTGRLVWTGAVANSAAAGVLNPGRAAVTVLAPVAAAGDYLVGTAAFGPALTTPGVSGAVFNIVEQGSGTGAGCTVFSGPNLGVFGKIALIDRGVCSFTIKVKNAQNAGAIGVIIADNVAGSPPTGLGGTDATITIPSVRVSQADGVKFRATLATGSRSAGLNARIGINPNGYQGTDALSRLLLYTPNPYQSGSSVSHYDVSATRNLLMEPAINGDLTHSVNTPEDLTFKLLQDIGW